MMEDQPWELRNIASIDVTGKSYNEAIEVAKQHIGFFIKIFEGREVNKFKFFIKEKFEDGEHREHIWLEVIDFREDSFVARVDNIPKNISYLKIDEIIDVNKSSVEDWIIVLEDGEMLGNFIFNSIQT